MKKIITSIALGLYIVWGLTAPINSLAFEEPNTVTSGFDTTTAAGEAEKTAVSAALMGMNQTLMEGLIFGAALGLMAVGIASGSDTENAQTHGHGH